MTSGFMTLWFYFSLQALLFCKVTVGGLLAVVHVSVLSDSGMEDRWKHGILEQLEED